MQKFFAILLLICSASPSVADILAQEGRIFHRLSLAAEQRAKVQWVAKESCLAMAGVTQGTNLTELSITVAVFGRSAKQLVSGGGIRKLEPEKDPAVLAALSRIGASWPVFSAAAQQLAAGDLHSVPLRQLLVHANRLEQANNDAMAEMVKLYRERLVTKKMRADTINVVSRQGAISQAIVRHVCMLYAGINKDRSRNALIETATVFKQMLDVLEKGDFDLDVMDPPGLSALTLISDLRISWQEMEVEIAGAIQGRRISADQVRQSQRIAKKLRAQSDELASLYIN